MPTSHLSKRTTQSFHDQLRLLNRNLEKLNETLSSVLGKLEDGSLPKLVKAKTERLEHLDAGGLMSLSDHLRKSAMVMVKLGEGTASSVSKETGRVRAVESDYLNQLVTMGYLRKRRVSKDIVFSVE